MDAMKTKGKSFFGMFKKGSGVATKAVGKMGTKMAMAGGTAAKGLGAVIGALSSIPVAGKVAAAVVAVAAGSIYAAWYNSAA
jgi:hypothetical protein